MDLAKTLEQKNVNYIYFFCHYTWLSVSSHCSKIGSNRAFGVLVHKTKVHLRAYELF